MVFISSPFRLVSEDPKEAAKEMRDNIHMAKVACEMVTTLGAMPLAPHPYFPRFLDDSSPKDRKTGLRLGLEWVALSADHNSQMMLYALGALHAYGYIYDIQTVRMSIISRGLKTSRPSAVRRRS